MITVAINDAFPIVLAGIERLLLNESDLAVVAAKSSVQELIAFVQTNRVDVVVLSTLPDEHNSLGSVRAFQAAVAGMANAPRIVLLADAIDEHAALNALRLGVMGTVLKHMPGHLLAKCIRKVAAGGHWIESQSHVRALQHLLARVDTPKSGHGLSTRESQVLRLVVDGRKNREIATSLEIAEGTVKTHVHNLCAKLNVKSRVGLTRYALANQLA